MVKRYETYPNLYFEPEEYEDICLHYIRMAQLEKAVQVAHKGLEFHPNYGMFYYHLGRAYMELSQYNVAVNVLTNALKQFQQDSIDTPEFRKDILLYIFDVYHLKAEIYLRKKDARNTTKNINLALKIGQELKLEADPYVDFATLYLQYHEYELGKKYLNKALQLKPGNKEIMLMLSKTYFSMNQPKKGLKILEEIVLTDPLSASEWCRLGIAYREMGHFMEAEKAFNYSTSLNPKHAESWYNFALLHLANEAYPKAKECLQTYDQLKPNQLMIHLNWIICERYIGQFEQALQHCTRLEELYPNHYLIQTEKAITLFHMEEYDQALELFENLLHTDNKSYALGYISKIYFEQKDLPNAIVYAKKAVKLDDSAYRWAWLGMLYLCDQNFKSGLQVLLKAYAINPDFPGIDMQIAVAYQSLGNTDMANEHIQIAIKKDPDAVAYFLSSYPDISNKLPPTPPKNNE